MRFTNEEVEQGRVAYETDRREHKHWQPHFDGISLAEQVHWIIMARGKKVEPPPLPVMGPVVVVSA